METDESLAYEPRFYDAFFDAAGVVVVVVVDSSIQHGGNVIIILYISRRIKGPRVRRMND